MYNAGTSYSCKELYSAWLLSLVTLTPNPKNQEPCIIALARRAPYLLLNMVMSYRDFPDYCKLYGEVRFPRSPSSKN